MKIILLTILTALSFCSFSQDTTAFRLIGMNTEGGLDYFYDDSTSMGDIEIGGNFSDGFAIFQHPTTGVLYAVLQDGGNPGGDRNLYSVNPLSGNFSLIKDFSNNYVNSADIATDGTIYFILGNGNATNANELFKYDLVSEVETFMSTPFMTGSRALEFNPTDSSLYLYEGYESDLGDYTEKLFVYNLSTNNVSEMNTTGLYDEIHGAHYDEESNTFLLSAYGGEMYVTDDSYLNGMLYHLTDDGVTGNNIMDIEKVDFIIGADNRSFCPGDSVEIKGNFGGVSYKWFMDGAEIIGETDSVIFANSPGVYKALMEVAMDPQTNYIWSEEITVSNYAVPVVSISSQDNDMMLCPEETITLTGTSGGTLQWYLDGAIISGANSSTYDAVEIGSYNQMKTNMSGCSDTADVDFIIVEDPNCTTSVDEYSLEVFQVYPNPTTGNLNILLANLPSSKFEMVDLTGKVVLHGKLSQGTNTIDMSELRTGVYFIKIDNGAAKKIIRK